MNFISYFTISALINFLASLAIGFIVISKNRNSRINKRFFLLSLSVAVWSFFYFLWQISNTEYWALIYCRLLMLGAIYMPFTFYAFIGEFLNIKGIYRLIGKIGNIISIIFIYLFLFTDLMIKGVSSIAGFRFWPLAGDLYFIYLLVFFLYFFIPGLMLYREYMHSVGITKLQIRYLFLGIFLAFIAGSSNYLLWYQVPIKPYANIFVSIYAVLTGYAIIKYRLMDISIIIKRSAVFASLVIILTTCYALLAYLISIFFAGLIGVQSVILNGISIAVFVAIGFEPLKKWLSRVTDNFLFKAEYKPQEVLAEFSDELTSTLDLKIICEYIVSKTHQVFKATKASLFLLDKDKKKYQVAGRIDSQADQLESIDETLFAKIFEYFKKQNQEKDIIVRDELKKINEQMGNKVIKLLIEQLDKYEVSLIVPMYVKDELVGILFLGDKKSGDIYSSEDIRILGIIAGQAAITIKNAQLYEEEKLFAVHLKEEVDRATKELRVANIQLKKLDEAKSEFISIASHQLRTPLTVIKGYLSMIDQGDFGSVPEKILGPLDKVSKSTVRIISLVEDLLNISRIESGRLKYDFEKVDINALTTEVFEELEMHAKNKGLKFTFEKPAKKIPLLKLDRNKVRETLMNLMDNAIKYTEKGWVKVNLEKLDDHVRFSVSDSGRGIAPDEMTQLFQKFSRIQGAQLVHTEGTGLGLYIAKEILKKHHAKIWVESPGTGKGSTFIIEFRT